MRPEARKWDAQIKRDGKNSHIGAFETELEAALAYDDAAFEIAGEHAYLNFPERKRNLQPRG